MADITTLEWRLDKSFATNDTVHALVAMHDPYVLTIVDPGDGKGVEWELLEDDGTVLRDWGSAPDRDATKAAAIAALEAELRNLITFPLKENLPEM